MKSVQLLFTALITLFLTFNLYSEPGFNGPSPGCSGSGCHSFQDNTVSVVPMSNLQVQVTITGTSSKVGGELVDGGGNVVAVINSTTNNPFILTAPSEGTYLVNAGYKNPSKRWDSTHVTLQLSLPPDPPSNLVAQFIPSPLSVQLTWTDNSNNEDGFIVEREGLGPEAFVIVDTVSANTTLYVDTTVTYLTYVYRLTAFNAFGQSAYSDTAQIVVPVELTSFNASIKDAGVLLEWTTATEINNMGFEIQRKTGADEFVKIGFVEGSGTTSEITFYQFFNDLSEFNSSAKLQYRLKQVDFNGVFSYSNIVEVDFLLENYSLSQNYPNPFNPSTIISFTLTRSTLVTLKIYNILGNEITTLVNKVVPGGNHQIEFNATGLPSGVYFYTITAGDFVETKKMALMK